jgi:hypothetical protein
MNSDLNSLTRFNKIYANFMRQIKMLGSFRLPLLGKRNPKREQISFVDDKVEAVVFALKTNYQATSTM